ncbi:hypothetical protein THICB1_10140 [Thiomonas arsenitoxydans]|jgi:hypothetical protein|uniref:Uncharacterized protein n=1 Tax=Thiomonas arsenitoxydans (strain DSM 22701 / CIP 110005 / 3As) TaxID=426114 RepID=A0ABM9SZL5_THIA3|nr:MULTISPECIES: hypothetical protein [Thiomonas]MDE1978940.1 hypothetical protein [Betaproteobacteria bacterium]CQR44253.1 hypothetical protein THICB3490100 [Thiomonas sp. CB3]MDE2269264.1 hypothetical protein [Betaproteobacteria bacterium]OZB72293.1 MAG: hypothetical protein B7X30_00110 [Thiomonas sp. 13-64-67]CDW95911.1 hypothetical protein THICB2_730023 [Thiomonas sp. CB2]
MCNRDIRIARRQVGQPLARLARLARTPDSFVALLLGIVGLDLLLTAGQHAHIHLDLVGIAQALAIVASTAFVGAFALRLRSDRLHRIAELSAAAAALQTYAAQLARAVQRYAATAQRLAAAVLRIAPHEDPQASVSGLATVCLTPRLVAQRPYAARVCAGMLH